MAEHSEVPGRRKNPGSQRDLRPLDYRGGYSAPARAMVGWSREALAEKSAGHHHQAV
jgi:hypothetical protein